MFLRLEIVILRKARVETDQYQLQKEENQNVSRIFQMIFFTRKAVKNTKQKLAGRKRPHRPTPEEGMPQHQLRNFLLFGLRPVGFSPHPRSFLLGGSLLFLQRIVL
jgi:hypothetical protein